MGRPPPRRQSKKRSNCSLPMIKDKRPGDAPMCRLRRRLYGANQEL